MSQSISSRISGTDLTIRVTGRFDFGVHRDFRSAYADALKPGMSVTVDMNGVDYMDSSALGMLLLLREFAGNDSADIKIMNVCDEVMEILKVANFHQLFKVL